MNMGLKGIKSLITMMSTILGRHEKWNEIQSSIRKIS